MRCNQQNSNIYFETTTVIGKAISINTEAAGTVGDVKQTPRDAEHTAGMDQP